MAETARILGVPFTARTHEAQRLQFREWLTSDTTDWHLVVTPNPEFLVRAWSDQHFRATLQSASVRLPDGFGVLIAARLLWGIRLHRFTGVDATVTLAQLAAEQNRSLFLLGAFGTTAQRASETLQRLVPGLRIAGAESGERGEGLIERLQQAAPDVLLVAFGAPKQEQWLREHASQLPSVRIAMGVGGTFDYFAGTVPRAPVLWRRLGLEWLYRLLHQPQRWRRIVTAVIIFPLLALGDRLWQLVRGPQIR